MADRYTNFWSEDASYPCSLTNSGELMSRQRRRGREQKWTVCCVRKRVDVCPHSPHSICINCSVHTILKRQCRFCGFTSCTFLIGEMCSGMLSKCSETLRRSILSQSFYREQG